MNRRSFLWKAVAVGSLAHQLRRPCLGDEKSASARDEALAAVDMDVRVERAEYFVINGARGLKWILVRLRTNQGVDGIGECWPWFQHNVIDSVRTVTDAVQGANPLEILSFVQRLSRQGKGLSWLTALSGVEIALWDIAGQLAGVPIHALFGGSLRDRIPLYANHGMFQPGVESLDARIERAIKAKGAGFSALKWDPTTPYGPRGQKDIDAVVTEIAAFRDALGPGFALGVDAHNNLSLQGALEVAEQLDEFGLMFFEAPVLWPNDQAGKNRPDALKQVAAATRVPIAIGEWLDDPHEAARLMHTASIRVIQPEVAQIGGIHAMWNVATVAQMYDVRVAAHHWTGPILALAASHVSATIPNLLRQEYAAAVSNFPWEYELVEPPLQIDRGQMVVSDRPGLGAKLNEKLVATRRVT